MRLALAGFCFLLLLAACSSDSNGPSDQTGSLRVETVTTGTDLDPDGYTVTLNGGGGRSIGVNASVTVGGLPVGSYGVGLEGVASNCTLQGANPRNVTVTQSQTAVTTFQLTCELLTGAVQVTTSTTGEPVDPDGYTLLVEGGTDRPIGVNETLLVDALPPGEYDLQLTDLSAECVVSGANPRSVAVTGGENAETTFDVVCGTPPTTITGVSWACTGLITDAAGSDLWPLTWADDGHQYTAWGDGDGFESERFGHGIVRLEGLPTGYTATHRGEFVPGGGGPKITSMLSIGGVLYLWLYNLDVPRTYSLARSDDDGLTYTVLFTFDNAPFQPNLWVQRGQDHQAADDGFVYMTSEEPDSPMSGDVYLYRVPESQIESMGAYEVFSGTPAIPAWSSDLTNAQSVIALDVAWLPTITFIPQLDQYILAAGHAANDVGPWGIYKADQPWGPWVEIASYTDWCGFGGTVTEMLHRWISPAWISANGSEFWMVFSGTDTWDRLNLIGGTFSLE